MYKLFFYAFLLLSGAGSAQWSQDPNINNAISTAKNDQLTPNIVSDGSGGAIIAWQDYRSNMSFIYAQRINSSGAVQWTVNGVVISTAANDQTIPAIVSDGSGGAVIAWQDYRIGMTSDIYAQRISSSGIVQWSSDGVAISTAAADQWLHSIISDGSGGAIITWADSRSGTSDIYTQRINSSGIVQWTTDGVAISTASNVQDYPTIVGDGMGGAIITWQDWRNGTADIYAQRTNSSGVVLWTADGVAVSTAPTTQEYPKIVGDGTGGAIITWKDWRNDAGDIYAQRISSSGVVQWAINGVAISMATNQQEYPTILSNGSDSVIITWHDYRSGTTSDIYAQCINSSGIVQWVANGAVISTAANAQEYPTIVSDGEGGAIIAWMDYRSSMSDIYAQRINGSGIVLWTTDGVAISTAANDQTIPAMVSDGTGGAVITWADYRSGASDIYAQKANHNGGLTGVENTGESLPVGFSLEQNYPNPFNPKTVISYTIGTGQLSDNSAVELSVHNLLGQKVVTLVNENQSPGSYKVTWNASGFSSGVYFYRLQAGAFIQTRKLILLR